jgi:hypothetical protein
VHGRDVARADDPQRGPLFLDEPRERDLERGGDRPQRLVAAAAGAAIALAVPS